MTDPLIRTDALTKRYPRVTALDHLTAEVVPGATGLLGPNGAGKTTLIRLALGLVRPTSGTIAAFGFDCSCNPLAVRARIGYAPEHESYVAGMSALDTVYLAARVSGLPHADAVRRAHEALQFAGLGESRYRKVDGFSTGMKQRVKIAQAIVHAPSLVILDEPTSGLDPRGRDEILAMVRQMVRDQGMSVLLSTHILHDVESVCERAVILHSGRLIHSGAVRELREGTRLTYDIRVGDGRDALARTLRERGYGVEPLDTDGLRLTPANGEIDSAEVFRAAAACGAAVRHFARSVTSLDDVFRRLVS